MRKYISFNIFVYRCVLVLYCSVFLTIVSDLLIICFQQLWFVWTENVKNCSVNCRQFTSQTNKWDIASTCHTSERLSWNDKIVSRYYQNALEYLQLTHITWKYKFKIYLSKSLQRVLSIFMLHLKYCFMKSINKIRR